MTIGNRPVHPIVEHHPNGRLMNFTPTPGMTLRQHYAGLALQALLSNSSTEMVEGNWSWRSGSLTGDAVQYADDLIAELEKQP